MKRKLIMITLCACLTLCGCAKQTPAVSEDFNIYEYLPTFADKADKPLEGETEMKEYTFVYLHCDTDQKFAYVQDFKDSEPTSPLYLYEFANPVDLATLLQDMPERSKEFEVEGDVENFYDHIEQYTDESWQTYEKGEYTFKYANTTDGEHFYNEKRIYTDNHPVCFTKELSDPYTMNEIEVTADAYAWLQKGTS